MSRSQLISEALGVSNPTLLSPASGPHSSKIECFTVILHLFTAIFSLSLLGQGPCLWWFILSEAIYSSVNNAFNHQKILQLDFPAKEKVI